MKKRKIIKTTAAGILASLTVTGCAFNPGANEPADIYGPPPAEDSEESEVPEIEPADPEETPEDFSPGDNTAEPLYGPPDADQ
jgi:hypothetical protein